MSDRDFILKKNVDDILQHYIYQAESMIGKPMMLMTKEEKIRALDYLDQKRNHPINKHHAGIVIIEINVVSTTVFAANGASLS